MNLKELPIYYIQKDFVLDIPADTDFNLENTSELMSWLSAFSQDKYQALYALGYIEQKKWFSAGLIYLHAICRQLIEVISHSPLIEFERGKLNVGLTDEVSKQLLGDIPYVIGAEFVTDAWLTHICQELLAVYNRESATYPGTIKQYINEKNSALHVADKIFFHLVENDNEDYPFAFMATYSKKPQKGKRTPHTPLSQAIEEYKDQTEVIVKLIASVIKVSSESKFINGLLESGELFSPIKLTSREAYLFLKEITLYESHGIMCRIPNWWKRKKTKPAIQMVIGEKKPSHVGLDAIMSLTPKFNVDDQALSKSELEAFLKMAEGIIKYKGKWIEVEHKHIKALLKAFDKIESNPFNDLTLAQLIKMEAGLSSFSTDIALKDIEIMQGDWYKSFKASLASGGVFAVPDVPESVQATLRTYQKKGYDWLSQMYHFRFGACLADDMGLGKTLQVIALLDFMRVHACGPVLIILPASLIANWQAELSKFAPNIAHTVLHPNYNDNDDVALQNHVYITTYGMVKRLKHLNGVNWELIVLDESQAIKNTGTQQTKAVKALKAKHKIALTGTPIENNLTDLWSLFDFLNPGLLGSAKEFKTLIKELENSHHGYRKLRNMIQPFMLRRLKTDRSIITDLPEKVELIDYANLSVKQVALYHQVVEQLEDKLVTAEGIDRKGLVLATLTKLKQICNHPDHYLALDEYKLSASGKFERLADISKTIYQKRERMLVFTQYKQVVEPLARFLTAQFGVSGLVLHGGTSVKKRGELIAKFNGERYVPFMILSLKAGGVGLNLTAANHVVHFDRWWNPAVENQATDRAFRIGQTKRVMVHKLVTKGTIEEKIDAMINDKKALADDLLSFGAEKWLTEMSNNELLSLFKLGV